MLIGLGVCSFVGPARSGVFMGGCASAPEEGIKEIGLQSVRVLRYSHDFLAARVAR